MTALKSMAGGYGGIGKAFEHARFSKWLASVFLLFFIGVYGLLMTFLLIVTSADVIDLILNFTAIEFISLLGKYSPTHTVAIFVAVTLFSVAWQMILFSISAALVFWVAPI